MLSSLLAPGKLTRPEQTKAAISGGGGALVIAVVNKDNLPWVGNGKGGRRRRWRRRNNLEGIKATEMGGNSGRDKSDHFRLPSPVRRARTSGPLMVVAVVVGKACESGERDKKA